MIELPVTLTSTGSAVSFASPVTLGYTKNKGVYRLLVAPEGEWQGLTIRCFWHLPGGTDPASSLVQDGAVDVPASVTAQPGTGCITFEGSDGEKTVTSADLRYKVGSNSGTEDGTMPEPGTPAWEQLVSATKVNADAAERAKNDAQAAAKGVETAAAKAEEAATKAEAAQKATEEAEASAAESIAGAKADALSAISAGEHGALGAVQQAQATATGAVQAAQTAAESAVSAAKTNAVQEVEAAAKPAQTAAEEAAKSAEKAAASENAAAESAELAKQQSTAARESAGLSQSAADAAAQAKAGATDAQTAAEEARNKSLEAQAGAEAAQGKAEVAAAHVEQVAARVQPIDDAAITTTSPWSSKQIVDTLCPPLEESGNPVVCYPVENYPLGVTVGWEPTQAGSGKPSPDNIRPISGRDSVEVTRCGGNLLDVSRVAENKGFTVDDSTIHVIDTSGWGASYILLAKKYPAGTYTIQIDADTAAHGRFLLRGYDANGNMVDVSILPKMIGYETSYNTYYRSTILYPYNPSGTHKVITFTVQGAAYFQVGLSGGLSVKETSANLKNFALIPGTTPPATYTPYTGQTNTLTLPTAIYGGEVDAVMGDGKRTWEIIDNYAGETIPREWISDRDVYSADKNPTVGAQVAYRLAEPVPFTATGAQPIPALSGTNTVLTDADNATVTGRADPIKRIADLEDKERKNDV